MRVIKRCQILLLNDLDLVADDRKCEVLVLACSNDSEYHANPSEYTNNGDAVHDANDDSVINVASYIG